MSSPLTKYIVELIIGFAGYYRRRMANLHGKKDNLSIKQKAARRQRAKQATTTMAVSTRQMETKKGMEKETKVKAAKAGKAVKPRMRRKGKGKEMVNFSEVSAGGTTVTTTYQTVDEAWEKLPKPYKKNHVYSTKPKTKLRAINRHNEKLRMGTETFRLAKNQTVIKCFVKQLEKLAKNNDPEKVSAIISKNIHARVILKNDGAKLVKPSNSMGIKTVHKKGKLSLCFGLLQVKVENVEWHIYVDQNHFFTIKLSLLPNAGYGLFAARDFERDDVVGYYAGKNRVGFTPKMVENLAMKMQSGEGGAIRAPGMFDLYMGIHYCNDPCLKLKKIKKQGTTTMLLFKATFL